MTEKAQVSGKISTAQLRKIKKPIIERRRRERINDSLQQLKGLVLEAMQKDESRYSKMEKADILEMTVKHLKAAQRQQVLMTSQQPAASLMTKYTDGFRECAHEVTRYLESITGLGPDVRMRLVQHLGHCAKPQVVQSPPTSPVEHRIMPATNMPSIPSATPMTSLPGVMPVMTIPAFAASQPITMGVAGQHHQVPVALSPGMIAVVPAPTNTGVNQPQVLKNAIPLYINTAHSPVMVAVKTELYSPRTVSPQTGDDAPMCYQSISPKVSPSQTVLPSLDRAGTMTRCHAIPVSEEKDVWRPW